MSLDDTARAVFEETRPPLGMLVAGRATEMLTSELSPEQRAPFARLTEALEAWWPHKSRDAKDIYEVEVAPILDLAEREDKATFEAPLRAAYVQLSAFLTVRPRSLPPGPFYDMGPDDFVSVLRDGAKAIRLPLAQLDARLQALTEHKKEKWPDLVARSRRMSWERGPQWGKLDKRILDLAKLADLGAKATWSKVGAQNALRLELDDVKRITVLKPEELEALRAVIPSIPEPG
ncbi:MAG: hypothetical protein AB7S26_37230 [Sandaracinaceae bacterium]